jgi:tRNA dimethylallyltransferase
MRELPGVAADDNAARIVVIAGPTAVGKTAQAVALAERFDGELVGADSVQVYRGFDIGSSKPTAAELRGVPHHLIDICEPNELIDAAGYAQRADAAIASVTARGKLPIVVGGTGLWLRALLRGLVAVPQVDRELRARLEAEWDAVGGAAMHERLGGIDPLSAARIHQNDKLRVVRALEVFEQTGVPLGEARRAHALGRPRYRALSYVLDLPGELHKTRVRERVDAMIAAGFVEETRALLARYGSEVRALGAVGYRQMVEHLQDGVPLAETAERIVRATLIYARRQRTWWGTDPTMHKRIAPDALLEEPELSTLAQFCAR